MIDTGLKRKGMGALALAAMLPLLSACGGSTSTTASHPASSPSPNGTASSSTSTGSTSSGSASTSSSSSGGGGLTALYQSAKKAGKPVEMVGPVPSANFQAVIQAFEKQFPGVKVQYQVVKNNVQLANLRVQMAAHKVQYDVAEGGDSELGTLIPQHMVTQVNWQQYGVPSKLIYHGLVEYNNLPTLFIYNVSKVPKNEVPHSWNDLLNPRWAGKIALDARGTFMTPFLLDPKMGGASAGVAWAKKALALKPLFEPSLSAIQPMVESGQVDIGGDAVDSALPPLLAPKGPLGIVPVSPIQVANFYAYVPQGAPHPSGGELMVAWMASPQGQSVLNVNYNGLVTSCSNPGPSLLTQLLCNNGITSWTSLQNLQQNEAAIKYYKTIQQTFGTYVGK